MNAITYGGNSTTFIKTCVCTPYMCTHVLLASLIDPVTVSFFGWDQLEHLFAHLWYSVWGVCVIVCGECVV